MAHQQRHYQAGGGGSGPSAGSHHQFGDTTYTKLFVGGLAWETQRDTMRRYFEQFGEIVEAVVITDKHTRRSKGYGFVTFTDPESAQRACQDPNPVIDGRRANCNLAAFGASAQQRRSGQLQQATSQPAVGGFGRYRTFTGGAPATIAAYQGPSTAIATGFYHQPAGAQYAAYPYNIYGYPGGFAQDNTMFPMGYYGALQEAGGLQQQQQIASYYAALSPGGAAAVAATAGVGLYQSYYPYYTQYPQQPNYGVGIGVGVGRGGGGYAVQQFPQQMVSYPYFPQQQQYATTSGILALPPSTATAITAIAGIHQAAVPPAVSPVIVPSTAVVHTSAAVEQRPAT